MSDSPRQAGTIEGYEGRGVWVPEGMNAHDIMEGAKALQSQFEVAPYTACEMARVVLLAVDPARPPN